MAQVLSTARLQGVRCFTRRIFNLRAVERDGTGDRQLTFGDVSYVEPDVHAPAC